MSFLDESQKVPDILRLEEANLRIATQLDAECHGFPAVSRTPS
jgi:hypothetical protein